MPNNHQEFLKRTRFNLEVRSHRVYVEHIIGYLKHYKVIGSIFRHNPEHLEDIVRLCVSLAQRRIEMFNAV